MKSIYRLVGAAGICFEAFGVRVGIRLNDPAVLGRLEAHLPPGWRRRQPQVVERLYSIVVNRNAARPGIRRFHLLYGNAQLLARHETEAELYEVFGTDLNSYLAQTSKDRFLVHAGVVGWNGKAIVIPGRSYSGKTTLVKEFLECGAVYYSDELAVFDRRGHVHPFPKPLGVRDKATQRQEKVRADEFGSEAGVKSIPVGLFLFTRYDDSACWRPKVISPGRAALKLLANAFSARKYPEEALAFLIRTVRRARLLSGARGEAKNLVRSVLGDWKA